MGLRRRIATRASMTSRCRRSRRWSSTADMVGPVLVREAGERAVEQRRRRHGGGHRHLLRRRLGHGRTGRALAERDHPRGRASVVREFRHRIRLGRRLAERRLRDLLHAALHRTPVRARRVHRAVEGEPRPHPRLHAGEPGLSNRARQSLGHGPGHERAGDLPEGVVGAAHAARGRRGGRVLGRDPGRTTGSSGT